MPEVQNRMPTNLSDLQSPSKSSLFTRELTGWQLEMAGLGENKSVLDWIKAFETGDKHFQRCNAPEVTSRIPAKHGQKIESTRHVPRPLESATLRAQPRPPRQPKPSHPAEDVTKNKPITKGSSGFSRPLPEFANYTHNSSSNFFGRAPTKSSTRPELPPKPKKPVPSSKPVEPDAIRSQPQQNYRTPTPTVKETPSKTNSSQSKITQKYLKSIVPPPSNPPEVPARNVAHRAQADARDTTETYSSSSSIMTLTRKPRAPINATAITNANPGNILTDARRDNARSKPERYERVAPAVNIHEINDKIARKEAMSKVGAIRRLGISPKNENFDNTYRDDSRRHQSKEEPFSKGGNSASMIKTRNESPDEFDYPEFNSRPEHWSTRPQNSNCTPVEEVLYDTPELENSDPDTCWGTSSTASYPGSLLSEEPLYQFIDAYVVSYNKDPYVSTYDSPDRKSLRRLSEELEQIHSAKLNRRTLWCRVDSVIAANVLEGMSRREIDLQEAKFEIYTTECSFLKSLKLLKSHYIMSSEFLNETILSKKDRGDLFMYVKPLMARSKAFLRDLDDCWKQSIFMHGIFEVICKHARKKFDIYITYCFYLNDTIEKLEELSSSKSFSAALNDLEKSEQCSRLTLLSFLTLPMTRITSMDLLIKKALSALTKEDKSLEGRKYDTDHDTCSLACDYVKRVCEKSNEAFQTQLRMKELFKLQKALSYPPNVRTLLLVSGKRWLIRSCDVTKHDSTTEERSKIPSSIVRSISSVGTVIKAKYKIFLFNDYLLLAKKKKSDGSSYKVVDYCRRQHAMIVLPSTVPDILARSLVDHNKHYTMLLVMNKNHEKKKVEMVLSYALKHERDRWVTLISEKVAKPVRHQETPMPYVCVHPFTSEEKNELSLVKGDEVMVIKKLCCGWLEGVRTRGKKTGIFPPSRVQLAKPRLRKAF